MVKRRDSAALWNRGSGGRRREQAGEQGAAGEGHGGNECIKRGIPGEPPALPGNPAPFRGIYRAPGGTSCSLAAKRRRSWSVARPRRLRTVTAGIPRRWAISGGARDSR